MAAKAKRRAAKKSKAKPVIERCVQHGCKSEAVYRGNCDTHYRVLLHAERAGETTWAELETKGLATPPKKAGRKVSALRSAISKTAKRSTKRK